MPASGTPGGGSVKLPQVKRDFLGAAKPAPKAPAAPALKSTPPQKVAVAAPAIAKPAPKMAAPAAPVQRATPAKAVAAVSPAIQAKQNFARAVASPNRAPAAQRMQKIQMRTKTR